MQYAHNGGLHAGVGSLKYDSNGDVLEMVIILPDEIDGLSQLEVQELCKYCITSSFRINA